MILNAVAFVKHDTVVL